MARSISAENIIFGFTMFTIIMISYGTSIALADVQNNMNQLFAGWPTFQQTVSALTTPSKSCAAWDFGCQAAQGISQATAFIGAVIAYPAVLAGSALSRISAFGSLMAFVTFGSGTSSLSAIPFGNLFLLGFFIIIGIMLFKLFRGSPSGL